MWSLSLPRRMETFTAGILLVASLAIIGCVANQIPLGPTPDTSGSVVMFTPPTGTYPAPTAVSLICNQPGATIYYTLDTNQVNPVYQVYTGPLTLSNSIAIRAYSVVPGWADSSVTLGNYLLTTTNKTAEPVFSLPTGSYDRFRSIFITSATPGSTIYFTVDGSTPTTLSPSYSPVAVSVPTTIKAMATSTNLAASAVVSVTITITN